MSEPRWPGFKDFQDMQHGMHNPVNPLIRGIMVQTKEFNRFFNIGDKTMRKQLNKIALVATLGLAILFTFSCSSDDGYDNPPPTTAAISSSGGSSSSGGGGSREETYYMETGTISETAYNYVKELDKPAEDLVTYCHRYRVPNDKYANAESGISRAKLEEELESLPGGKAAVLRSLDKDGAVFGIFTTSDESIIFLYIEKEKHGSGSGSGNGNDYNIVVIGTQTWMAENLNYDVPDSKCYDNDPTNCAKYGRLYNWATAKTICPSGWHLPNDAEWTTLENYVGGSSTAGIKLKATSGWNANGNGTNNYNFSALPGGAGSFDGGFVTVGFIGGWWSSTEYSADRAYYREMASSYAEVRKDYIRKISLISVRCVKD